MRFDYAFADGEPKRLTIEHRKGWRVYFEGQQVAQLTGKKLRAGYEMILPDRSSLYLKLEWEEFLRVFRDGRLVPGWDTNALDFLGKFQRFTFLVSGASVFLGLLMMARTMAPSATLNYVHPVPLIIGGSLLFLAGLFSRLRWWPGLLAIWALILADTAYFVVHWPGWPMAMNLAPRLLILFAALWSVMAIRFLNRRHD